MRSIKLCVLADAPWPKHPSSLVELDLPRPVATAEPELEGAAVLLLAELLEELLGGLHGLAVEAEDHVARTDAGPGALTAGGGEGDDDVVRALAVVLDAHAERTERDDLQGVHGRLLDDPGRRTR